jgi:ADP-ribose pyrophosphatase
MYRIYFDERSLTIFPAGDPALKDGTPVIDASDTEKMKMLAIDFDKCIGMKRLYISAEDEAAAVKAVKAQFTEICAAGGLIRDDDDKYLFIYRLGRWDLPKGKQEEGEDIRLTAVREVQEETGLKEPELGELICITHHTYHRDGKFFLKHTWWYEMRCKSGEKTIPQTEEDIQKIVWAEKKDIGQFVSDTYPSIVEVLTSYQLL